MSQFLLNLHNAKELHVSRVINKLREAGTSQQLLRDVERLLTDAFIAGARAATSTICEKERQAVDRLADMETERRRHAMSAVIPFGQTDAMIARIEAASKAAQGEGAFV